MHKIIIFLAAISAFACQNSNTDLVNQDLAASGDTSEFYRPFFHFTPQNNWMNDPNGMFYKDSTYHLYFQYYPDGNQWGPMHWGHASTKDLVHWKEHDIALYPDSALGYIFSGSAVLDSHNTSGLGIDGEIPIVAMYTFHKRPGDIQTQGISYSLDGGMTYSSYDGNPVLPNENRKDFRDPKVFWDGNQWVAAITHGNEIGFYGSDNLLNWKFLSTFNSGHTETDGVWECPDLFKMSTSQGDVHVLIVSIGTGSPNGGSGTKYYTGHWDGMHFKPNHQNIKWLDHGRDNYAGVTWHNAPGSSSNRLFMGWMSNWDYAQEVPTYKWRSTMTLARYLTLDWVDGECLMFQNPAILDPSLRQNEKTILPAQELDPSYGFEWLFRSQGPWSLTLTSDQGDSLLFEVVHDTLYFDRSRLKRPQAVGFVGVQKAPLKQGGAGSTQIILDKTSIEVFAEDGLTAMTVLAFPKSYWTHAYTSGMSGKTYEWVTKSDRTEDE